MNARAVASTTRVTVNELRDSPRAAQIGALAIVVVVTTPRPDERLDARWRPQELAHCEVLVVGPNDYPPNAEADSLIDTCVGRTVPVVGPNVAFRAYRCARVREGQS